MIPKYLILPLQKIFSFFVSSPPPPTTEETPTGSTTNNPNSAVHGQCGELSLIVLSAYVLSKIVANFS